MILIAAVASKRDRFPSPNSIINLILGKRFSSIICRSILVLYIPPVFNVKTNETIKFEATKIDQIKRFIFDCTPPNDAIKMTQSTTVASDPSIVLDHGIRHATSGKTKVFPLC